VSVAKSFSDRIARKPNKYFARIALTPLPEECLEALRRVDELRYSKGQMHEDPIKYFGSILRPSGFELRSREERDQIKAEFRAIAEAFNQKLDLARAPLVEELKRMNSKVLTRIGVTE